MLTLPIRKVLLAESRAPWSIATNIGARLVADWNAALDHGTARMTVDGSERVSAWADRIGNLTLTSSLDARPTWTSRGVFFDGVDDFMTVASIGSLPTGTAPCTIYWVGTQLGLDANPRNLVSYGASGAARVLRANAASHRPGVSTVAVDHEDTTRHFVGRSVIVGYFANGRISLRYQGEDCGGTNTAFDTTGTMRTRFGANTSTTAARFACAYFERVMIVSGYSSVDEMQRVEAALLGGGEFDGLPAGHPYRATYTQPTFADNIAAINTAIAAKPSTTPDQESDMASPPTVAAYDGDPNPTDFPLGADVVNERPLITLRQGWTTTDSINYVSSPMGLLGVIADVLRAQTTSFRAEAVITSRHVAVNFYGVVATKIRLIVKQAGDPCGLYVDVDGQDVAGDTGSNTITYDFGSVARREIAVEIPGSNMFAGFYVEAGGIIEPMTYTRLPVSWISDSFGAGTGADQNWWAFNILTGDRLGLNCGNFAGNVGGGFEADSGGGGIYNLTNRLPDITDSDLTQRNSISITAYTNARLVIIALGVNDVSISHTRAEWQAIIQAQLEFIRARLPWAPIICVGPWDRYYPSPVAAGWIAVDGGLQDAVAQIAHCTYLDMEGVDYTKVGGGNIHPTNVGHQELADNLAPRIEAALLAMA